MDEKTLKQEYVKQIDVEEVSDDIWVQQSNDLIIVEKKNIPDLIKILQSFVVMLLLSVSVSVFGQTDKSKADTTEWFSVGKYSGHNNDILLTPPIVYDTIPSWLLTTTKEDLAIMTQIKGYTIKHREMAIGLIMGNYKPSQLITYGYLDNNKKPMPDDCIVWMSVKR